MVIAYIRGSIRREIPVSELAPYVTPWSGESGQSAFYRQIAQMDQRYTDEVEPRYPQPAHSIESCHTQPSMPHARGQLISNSTLPSPSIVPRTLSGPSEK